MRMIAEDHLTKSEISLAARLTALESQAIGRRAMHSFRGILLGLGLVCAAGAAHAQRKVDNIGNGGGIVIGAERLAGVYHTTNTVKIEQEQDVGGTSFRSETESESSITTLAVFGHDPGSPTEIPRLALDYFVVDGFSVGGSFMFMRNALELDLEQRVTIGGNQTTSSDDGKTTQQAFVFHPRLGYAVAFNEYVGIWPRVGFSYTHIERVDESTVTDPVSGAEEDVEEKTTITLTNLTLEGLLFVSPFSNFAFVAGPFADIGLGGKSEFETTQSDVDVPDGENKVSAFGFIVGIAGYFDTR
jgi:hypothetical protein